MESKFNFFVFFILFYWFLVVGFYFLSSSFYVSILCYVCGYNQINKHIWDCAMQCIIGVETKSGWLLHYEKTFVEEIATYEKSKVNNCISFLRFCFLLTIIFGISFCW
jgi:hypothetical protein